MKIEPVLLIVFLVIAIAILFIINDLNKNNNKATLILEKLEKVDKLLNKISDKNAIAANIAESKRPIGFNLI